jgi:hypothetical protein
MSRVEVAASEDLVAIAVAAGGSPSEMIYHEDTGELECPDVTQQANLDTALASVASGTALATDPDRTSKIEELRTACRALIEGGFQSTAGSLHTPAKWYDSEVEDQLNLIGNAAAGDDTIHAFADGQGGAKTYANHTNAQLTQVLKDGRDRKLAIRIEYATLKAQCLAATTLGELGAITWTMT